ncbi:MAG: hypothetical protein ACOC2L_02355 [Candidatus Sumerlaeota bacterium]
MRKKILIVVVVLLLVVVGIAAFIVLNAGSLVARGIEQGLSHALLADVSVGSVELSLRQGQVDVYDLQIASPEGYDAEEAFSFAQARVSVVLASLNSDTIHIKEIVLMDPSITLEQKMKSSNLRQLQKNASRFGEADEAPAEELPAEEKGAGKKVVIDQVRVEDTRVQIYSPYLDEPKGLTLSPFVMEDFGRGNNAITVAHATARFLNEMLKQTVAAGADVLPEDVTKQLDQGLGILEKGLNEGSEGVMRGVKGVLGDEKEK